MTSDLITPPAVGVGGRPWPGTRSLAVDPTADVTDLNLDIRTGQRVATWTFQLIDGVTGQHLGELHPIRQPATITHDITRVIKRDLRIALHTTDQAAINPIRDRILVTMNVAGTTYPLGRYMFIDATLLISTGGDRGMTTLLDEMFLIDQQLEQGFSSTSAADNAVRALLAGLPIPAISIEATPYPAVGGWGAGTTRGQVLDALATQGDYQTPWMDNTGAFAMVRTRDPDTDPPDLDLDTGRRVIRDSPAQTSDVLNAPNRFVVVGNSGSAAARPVTGIYDVPANAPHSITNRGFVIPAVFNLQVASTIQAKAVARNLGLRQTVSVRLDLETVPDPRHDGYQIIRWRQRNWLELAWSMTCEEGASMRHALRRSLTI